MCKPAAPGARKLPQVETQLADPAVQVEQCINLLILFFYLRKKSTFPFIKKKRLFKFFRKVPYAVAVTLLFSPLPKLTVSSLSLD